MYPHLVMFLVPGCYVPSDDAGATYDDAALVARLDQVEAELASLRDDLDACEERLDGAIQLLDADETIWTVTADGTGAYPTLMDAIAALDGYHVGASATVTIQLEPGTYSFSEPVTFRHPDGGRVRIVGDESDPTAVQLSFSGTDGVVVTEGATLGYLGGVSILGVGGAGTNGLLVEDGSLLELGSLEIADFETCVHARFHSSIRHVTTTGADTLRASGCTYGVHAQAGSGVTTSQAVLEGIGEGVGLEVDFAYLSADHATVSEFETGANVVSGGLMALNFATISTTSNGLWAEGGGTIYAEEAVVTDASNHAYHAEQGGMILAPSSIATASAAGSGYWAGTHAFINADQAVAAVPDYGFWSSEHAFVFAEGTDAAVTGSYAAYATRHNGAIDATNYLGQGTLVHTEHDALDFIIGL